MSHTHAKANQQSPLLDKGGPSHQHHAKRPHKHPPWLYIVLVDFINLVMTASEIALVLYLTIHHIQENQGVIAVAMLAPILLNFVGVTYFFSDQSERDQFEKVGTRRITKDLFQVPVLGPVFTALKVLMISSGLSKNQDIEYERFEASAVKMRQAQTFFSASPEAVVQLSVLLISTDSLLTTTHMLEILVVVVSVFTLAESNVYALRSNYFRLFHSYEEGDWEVHESFGRKVILFFHSFTSIGSRIAGAACLIAGMQCISMRTDAMRTPMARTVTPRTPMSTTLSPRPSPRTTITTTTPGPWGPFPPRTTTAMPAMIPMSPDEKARSTQQLAMVIVLTLLALIIYHMLVYYIARFLRYACKKRAVPGGCYESVNYGWRSAILHTGFQSKNLATQLWFYCENCAMFLFWWVAVESLGDVRVKQNTHIPMALGFTFATVLSIFFLFAAVGTKMHRLESPFKKIRDII